LFYIDSYVKSRFIYLFEYLFANFIEEVALRIKSNFLHILIKLINIHTKVHLDLSTLSLKVIYLKL